MELKHLTERQSYVALISIHTAIATVNVDSLKKVLADALDFGMTINEINEEIVHLYAYLGFAPACRATTVFMNLVNERRNQGIYDEQGREASPVDKSESKYTRGEKLQMFCAGMTAKQLRNGFFGFNPLLDFCLKEHLFADLFARDLLSYVEREIITVSALAAIKEPMVESHYGGALNVGVTKEQLREILTLVGQEVSTEAEEIGYQRLEHTLNIRNQKQ